MIVSKAVLKTLSSILTQHGSLSTTQGSLYGPQELFGWSRFSLTMSDLSSTTLKGQCSKPSAMYFGE